MSRASQHTIPPHVNNSTLRYLIDERIRNEDHQEILRKHWFRGKSFYMLSKEYDCSLTHIKDVVYGFGDPLLLEAADMDATENHIFSQS